MKSCLTLMELDSVGKCHCIKKLMREIEFIHSFQICSQSALGIWINICNNRREAEMEKGGERKEEKVQEREENLELQRKRTTLTYTENLIEVCEKKIFHYSTPLKRPRECKYQISNPNFAFFVSQEKCIPYSVHLDRL